MHSVPSGQSVEDHGYVPQDRAPQLRTRTPGAASWFPSPAFSHQHGGGALPSMA